MEVEVICVDDEDGEIFSQEATEPQPLPPEPSSSGSPAAEPTFEQEYDVLRRAAEEFEPPLEAIAELLLRHPHHWWCKYVHSTGWRVRRTKNGVDLCFVGLDLSLSPSLGRRKGDKRHPRGQDDVATSG